MFAVAVGCGNRGGSMVRETPASGTSSATRPGQPEVVCRHRIQLAGQRSDGAIGSVYIGAQREGHAFVASDAAGNIVVVASFLGMIDLGGGLLSANDAEWALFIAKYDPRCKHVWSRTFGSPGGRVDGGPIAIGAQGDIVLGGGLAGTVDFGNGALRAQPGQVNGWVARLRDDGTPLFSKVFPGDLSQVRAVSIDADDNAVITGSGSANTSLGGAALGEYGTFVAKFSPAGMHLWSRRLPSGIAGVTVRTSASGDLLLSGVAERSFSWGDGSEPLQGAGGLFFVSRLDPQGAHRWSTRIASESVSWGSRVAYGPGGIAYATFGTSPDTAMKTERVLERIDASGKRLSTVKWPGASVQGAHAWDLAVDSNGNALELGVFSEPLALDGRTLVPRSWADVYLAKRDPSGRSLWATQQGSARFNQALGVVADPEDHPIVAWYTVDAEARVPDEIEIVKFAP